MNKSTLMLFTAFLVLVASYLLMVFVYTDFGRSFPLQKDLKEASGKVNSIKVTGKYDNELRFTLSGTKLNFLHKLDDNEDTEAILYQLQSATSLTVQYDPSKTNYRIIELSDYIQSYQIKSESAVIKSYGQSKSTYNFRFNFWLLMGFIFIFLLFFTVIRGSKEKIN